MALLNDDAFETGENVYKVRNLVYEASEPIFKKYLRWKHTILLKSQYITLLINHCLSVQYVHDCVRITLVICSCSLYWLENKKLEKNYIERAERERAKIFVLLRRKNVLHTDQKLEKKLL